AFSRSAYYSAVAALPLLAAYELLLVLAGNPRGMQVRSAADVWLRTLLESLGAQPSQATWVMMLLVALSIPLARKPGITLEPRYFALMLLEALAYSVALGVVINLVLYFLVYSWAQPAGLLPGLTHGLARTWAAAVPAGQTPAQAVALSLGAGLFEEFVFRVVLVNTLLFFSRLLMAPVLAGLVALGTSLPVFLACSVVLPAVLAGLVAIVAGAAVFVIGYKLLAPWLPATVAVAGAALLFALAHYLGPLADSFSVHSFLFRALAGLIFTVLYYQRGFAIAAYSHALYDIWVLAF
ncbi:MAG TPA: CPBP family glutamic-type intramembrane protease, partial [bacterium]|nr:CPBP family glutamic-type intramembrane protease [bacterium]